MLSGTNLGLIFSLRLLVCRLIDRGSNELGQIFPHVFIFARQATFHAFRNQYNQRRKLVRNQYAQNEKAKTQLYI